MTGRDVLHYARPLAAVRKERWIDAADYRDCPPKACGTGDYHARHTHSWRAVTCPACLARKPTTPTA